MDELKMATARMLIAQMKAQGVARSFSDIEFQAFSQFGDDGIVQYLVHQVGIPQELKTFVEFGVEGYEEANTRFLLMNDNWRGLIMDGSDAHMRRVRSSQYYWRYSLQAVAAFITRENVNDLIGGNGVRGEIGLLSIDIDGNDYWVWQELTVIKPWIVIVEYNSAFGAKHAVTIPYDPHFTRTQAHHSNLYWGSSLRALSLLARDKGYVFLGCNSAGNNAYFVLADKLGTLPSRTVDEGYVESRFRESRDRAGNLTFVSGADRMRVVKDMEVHDVEANRRVRIADLFAET
jgi:hypothetical protein